VESLQLTLFEAPEPEPSEAGPSADEVLASFRQRLLEQLGEVPLRKLVLTDNRSTLLSSRIDRDAWLDIRLNWSFVDAPAPVLAAVARVALGVDLRRSRATLREWVTENRRGEIPEALEDAVIAAPRSSESLLPSPPAFDVHDLEAIRDEVNERYFEGRHPVAIGWSKVGRPRRRGRRRTIKLGSWSEDDRTVRIHPALDHPSVPRWVVESVVHHELLHADLDTVVSNGRRRLHTPEFRRREREFERHDDARRWIDRHLGALLRRRARLSR
jgi:hypothetical protein